MSKLDEMINSRLQSSQFAVGFSTVLISLLSKNIIPKLPPSVYKLLDVTAVRILVIAFLLATQTKKPTWSILTATVLVVGLRMVAHEVSPEIPPLSEIVKPNEEGKDKEKAATNCHCHCEPQTLSPQRQSWPNWTGREA